MTLKFVARRFLTPLALAGLLGGCTTVTTPSATAGDTPSDTHLAQLRQALAKADQVTIVPQVASGTAPAPVVLKGPDAITALLDTLKIDEDYGPVRYDCSIDVRFTFAEGDRDLLSLDLRRLDHLRWVDGPWGSDAVLTLDSYQKLENWCRQNGVDITAVVRNIGLREASRQTAAARRFLADFPPAAQQVFADADSIQYTGSQVRRIETTLGSYFTDPVDLIHTGFLALADSPTVWLDDDWSVAAVQSAILELDPAVVLREIQNLPDDDPRLLGAARFFFRNDFASRLAPADANAIAVRLADAALKSGSDADKPTVLEYVAGLPGDATGKFLREVADGTRKYTYATPYDRTSLAMEEPSLPATAALWLAWRGDSQASRLLSALASTDPYGPDEAALQVADAVLNPRAPLTIAHFKYRSRSLGMVALKALSDPARGSPSADLLAAACGHLDREVARRAALVASDHGLQPVGASGEDPGIDVDPLLCELYPSLAVKEYTRQMDGADGVRLETLLNLRARAYVNLGDYDQAEIDYLNVISGGGSQVDEARSRLAWVQWYLGEYDAAEETIATALQAAPQAELLLLRGIMRYTQGDFGSDTDADLTAATLLDPNEGYAPLFRHLAAMLDGRPGQSRLREYFLSGPDLQDWTATVIAYMLGVVTPSQLLQLASVGTKEEIDWHTCEANFYLSQAARIDGRTADERRYLAACVATNQPRVAEYWVARQRLRELQGPGSPTSPRSPSDMI